MSNTNQNLRHQLDAPMRKVRDELGLPPLGGLDNIEPSDELLTQANQLMLLRKHGFITQEEARDMFKGNHLGMLNAHKPLILEDKVTLTYYGGPK